MRLRLRQRAIVLFSVFLAHAGNADLLEAQDVTQLLQVNPGATCLRAQNLAEDVYERLGDMQLPPDLRIVVDGSRQDPRNAELQVTRAGSVVSRRSFVPGPDTCDALQAMVALAVTLALKAAREEFVPVPRRQHNSWSVGVSGLVNFRIFPELTAGVAATLSRSLSDVFQVRLTALGIVLFHQELPQASGSFRAVLSGFRAEGCAYTKLEGRLSARGCLGMLAGLIYAAGIDTANAGSTGVPYFAPSLALELDLALSSRWTMQLSAAAMYALHAVAIGLEDHGVPSLTLELSQLSFAIGLGPSYAF